MTGDFIDAAEANRIGLYNRVVEDADLIEGIDHPTGVEVGVFGKAGIGLHQTGADVDTVGGLAALLEPVAGTAARVFFGLGLLAAGVVRNRRGREALALVAPVASFLFVVGLLGAFGAIATPFLRTASFAPLFLWLHLFDPHLPYFDHVGGDRSGDSGKLSQLNVIQIRKKIAELDVPMPERTRP